MVGRILIKGSCGAGKSTLGQALARHLEVPWIELDALHHGPNWVEASTEELTARVLERLDDTRGWVADGNYDSKLGTLLWDRADLIVWLDLPLYVKFWRVLRRTSRRWWRQEELWNGNRETLRGIFWGTDALLLWTVRAHYRHRRRWPRELAGREHVRLRTLGEVQTWYSDFCGLPRTSASNEPGSVRR